MDVGQGMSSPTTGMTSSPRSLQTPPNLDNMTLGGGDGNPSSNGGMVSPKQHVTGLSQMGSPGSSLGRSSSVSPPGPALSLVTTKPYQASSSQPNGGLPPSLPRSCGQNLMPHHQVSHPQMGHPPLGYHRSLHPSSSPPGIAADMTTNDCRLIDYRGAKVAAFLVHGDYLLCLPQAFELFLKHLVGGLHTVYTKLKRLDITPIVCNVEQVRILRGLGAIQPGVNRCKLLSCKDFDALYKDCTTARRCFSAGRDIPHHELAATSSIYGPIDNSSRPGRPPKRVSMVSMTSGVTTTGMVKKSRLDSDYHSYENGHITGDRLDKHMLPNGYGHPGTTSHLSPLPFMALNSSHHNSVITGGVSMATTATHSSHASSRGDVTRERQMGSDVIASTRLRDDRVDASDGKDRLYYDVSRQKDSYVNGTGNSGHSPVLNLSQNSSRGGGGGGGGGVGLHSAEGSGSEGPYNDGADDDYSDDDDDDRDQDFSDHPDVSSTANGERLAPSQMFPFSHLAVDGGSPTGQVVSSIETLLRNIQGLLKVAADNARQQERQINIEKAELKMEVLRERELRETLEKQLLDEQRTRILYQKRLKKEKRSRRRFQEQLESEVKKRAQYEEALRTTSADTIRLLNDTLTQELERERNSLAESENNAHDCQMTA
ncbi:dachshund homolog 1-like [Parasteatoda tepidariorum]|uniref:Dachshund-2 n=1 Tax=Parasteatoda tepidariorum TaxID=114398 RepID=A0A0G3Y5G3_PARTP|nr:dachshund homolog 1-like [Parasteatoda tepidariorum]AKM21240.2 dachshund-2 [Parasteatoda tepidariorum]